MNEFTEEELASEEWRDVPNAKNAQASSLGQIRTKDRTIQRANGGKGVFVNYKSKIFKQSLNSGGYPTCFVQFDYGWKWSKVHRIIASVFLPNPGKLPEVNHVNGIKTYNRAKNLEWITRSGNSQHAFDMGLQKPKPGSTNPASKLNEQQVLLVRELWETTTGTELATMFGVTQSMIHKIVYRDNWRHI